MEHPKYKIIEPIATLSSNKSKTLELNWVSWNDYPARIDLRRWGTNEQGERVPFKGLSLTDAEVEALKAVLPTV